VGAAPGASYVPGSSTVGAQALTTRVRIMRTDIARKVRFIVNSSSSSERLSEIELYWRFLDSQKQDGEFDFRFSDLLSYAEIACQQLRLKLVKVAESRF
jgi:hypothetical protein